MSATVRVAQDGAGARRTRVLCSILAAVVVSAGTNFLIAAIAHAAGASENFRPLEPSTFLPLTVIGILVATGSWSLLRRAPNARRTAKVLVPTVVALSLVPDLLVGMGDTQLGANWTGVVALMTMHVAIAAITVPLLTRALPLPTEPKRSP